MKAGKVPITESPSIGGSASGPEPTICLKSKCDGEPLDGSEI
jgi:hypothetical protein